jgi:hypothetical protein
MWLACLPIGWYLFSYVIADLEYVQILAMGVPAVLGLLIILHAGFRGFIWTHFAFMYNCFEEIEEWMNARKIARLSRKEYVHMKKLYSDKK